MKLFCKACVCIPFAVCKFLLVLCIVMFHSLWKLLQEITTSAARQAVSNKASDCLYDEATGMYRFERGGYRHGNRIWGNIPSSSMQNFHCHLQGTDIQSTGFIVGIVFSAESFHVMYFSNKDIVTVFFMCLHGRWVKYRVISLFHGLKPHISTQPLLNQSTGKVFLNIFYPRAISSPPQSAGNSDNSVLQNNLRDLFDAITQVKCLC